MSRYLFAFAMTLLTLPALAAQPGLSTATFAGGCFWCVEADFLSVPGVVEAVSGFSGGSEPDPTYKQVSAGLTGHLEAVQVTFDPARVSYAQLVEWFWRHHDPTDADGQFCDRGRQYGPAIFVHDKEQRRVAEESRRRLVESKVLPGPVRTPIVDFAAFFPAEEYHQRYSKKNPLRYQFYRFNCEREATLRALWGEQADKPFSYYQDHQKE
ncbi:peptide-methionine (S)-S-oxide reductase MsrA [Desulfocurvus vexinensis]|uniref:peptide-methionine (S)-S-oxide reductase MsrA n=1 Tax=Desulfocurvus vexinensis TaxID=399548 RepID=UPI001FE0DDE5|nr:peptide-methionine (S)-S-oxide reductase MsrA [Desulfocurvus vexinensis]